MCLKQIEDNNQVPMTKEHLCVFGDFESQSLRMGVTHEPSETVHPARCSRVILCPEQPTEGIYESRILFVNPLDGCGLPRILQTKLDWTAQLRKSKHRRRERKNSSRTLTLALRDSLKSTTLRTLSYVAGDSSEGRTGGVCLRAIIRNIRAERMLRTMAVDKVFHSLRDKVSRVWLTRTSSRITCGTQPSGKPSRAPYTRWPILLSSL